MDSIKAQKLQAMKTYKKAHKFVYNFVVYALTAFLSSLFYLYMFCFPSMRQYFLFDFLPYIYSFLLSPKFLFLLGNTIVIILFVGESSSSKAGSSSSSPATEIYDEYMEIRRRNHDLIRRRHVAVVDDDDGDKCNKKDCKNVTDIAEMDNNNNINMHKSEKMSTRMIIRRNCSLNDINKCIEERKKKKEMAMAMAGRGLRKPRSTVERSKKKKEDEGASVCKDDEYQSNIIIRSPPALREEIRRETSTSQSHVHGLSRPQSLGRLDMHQNQKEITNRGDIVIKPREDKRKEMEKSMDELNRRVEDFIARVNRQRLIEAQELELELDSRVEF